MPKISELPSASSLTGLELAPVLQGAGVDGGLGIPLLAYGNLPRGAVLLLRTAMTRDLSNTADADPGVGNVRFNNAAPGSATVLYVSKTSAAPASLSIGAQLLGASIGSYLYLQSSASADRDNLQKWQISSITDATGYVKIGVALVTGGGDMTTGGTGLELTLQQPAPTAGADRNVVTALASSAGVVTVDVSLGDFFTLTPTENITGWAFANEPQGYAISIVLKRGATAYTVAMPSGVKWIGGTAATFSTAANALDELAISSTDAGSTKRAVLGKAFA